MKDKIQNIRVNPDLCFMYKYGNNHWSVFYQLNVVMLRQFTRFLLLRDQ